MNKDDEQRVVDRARRFLTQREEVRRMRKWSLLIVAVCIVLLGVVQLPSVIEKTQTMANPEDFLSGLRVGFGLGIEILLLGSFITLMIFTLFRRAEGTWPVQELLVKYHDRLNSGPDTSASASASTTSTPNH